MSLYGGKKPNWKENVLFHFCFVFFSHFFQNANFCLYVHHEKPPTEGRAATSLSPACFIAPHSLLLLLFQSLGTGIALGFISKTAALAECGAKPTKDSGNLCTDSSDLWIKCTKISLLRASRELLEVYSSLLKKRRSHRFAFFFPPPFFLTHNMSLLIFAA